MSQAVKFNRGLLKYVEGDATLPRGGGHRMLIHVCNDIGGFGAGVAQAIAQRYPKVRDQYKLWFRAQTLDFNKFELGSIQIVPVQTDLSVVNMIAQSGIGPDSQGNPPIRYDAVRTCLQKVLKAAKDSQSSIHAPKFGAGLAGGDWAVIEQMINEILIDNGMNVTIYTLSESK